MKRSHSLVGGTLAGTLLFCSSAAHAHVKLLKPAPWINESSSGGPQKGSPCGPGSTDPLFGDDVQPVPTNGKITTFTAGETITVEWTETVAHPGYYRIAVAENRADLKDPDLPFDALCNVDHSKVPTTPHGNVLADGVMLTDNARSRAGFPNLKHTITLPNKPCEKCTLQLIQFMEVHPPGCIYYHCADIKIVAAGGGMAGDAGVSMDAGSTGVVDASRADAGGALVMPSGGATGGAASGGAAGGTVAAGGMPGTGAAGGTTTTTSPATGNAGGAGTGGVPPVGTAGGTAGAAPLPAAADDDDGGCSVAFGDENAKHTGVALVLLSFAFLRRRRQRRA